MPNYNQPTDVLDQGDTLFSLLGSFWSDNYAGSQQVQDVCKAKFELILNTWNLQRELAACVSRTALPLYHQERWIPLTIRLSEQLNLAPITYQPGVDVLGPAPNTILAGPTFDYALPTDINGTFVDAALCVDRITSPNAVWVRGVDYWVDLTLGAIRFVNNPFSQGFKTRAVPAASGALTDQELVLWLGFCAVDRQYLSYQFGYQYKLPLNSTEASKTLINAVWDAEMRGPCPDTLTRALSGICDAPYALNTPTTETVQYIYQDNGRQRVITDQNVYSCSLAATLLVSIGQVLTPGQPICNAFQIVDLTQGTPAASVLPSLTVPPTMLLGAFSGGLTFYNLLSPIKVSTVSGRTYVTFPLGGASGDVSLFFSSAQAAGILPGGKTIAQMLDLRPQPQTTDPDVNSLPTQVNPLDFLIRNVMRFGLAVVLLVPASFGPNAAGLSILDRVMRLVVPPQGTYLAYSNALATGGPYELDFSNTTDSMYYVLVL